MGHFSEKKSHHRHNLKRWQKVILKYAEYINIMLLSDIIIFKCLYIQFERHFYNANQPGPDPF